MDTIKVHKPVLYSLLLCLLSSCLHSNRSESIPDAKEEVRADTSGVSQHDHRPDIPSMMTEPDERANYYVTHYWDRYPVTDTAFVHSDTTEQLYVDFINALQYIDATKYRLALHNMMSHMEADSIAYKHFCSLNEKYLYDPNSPMRNESYYIPVLEQMLSSRRITAAEKIRPADRLKQTHKNRPGMVAADFSYVTPKNKIGRVGQINADYTLLFFYDPDCTNCRESEQTLSSIPAFVEMQKRGELQVLAIYPDEDGKEWLLKSSDMPEGWIVGWNKQGDIRSKQLYEIRATPALYLLDKHKKVILKDAPLEQLLQYLSTIRAIRSA